MHMRNEKWALMSGWEGASIVAFVFCPWRKYISVAQKAKTQLQEHGYKEGV